jgi:TolB-like protein
MIRQTFFILLVFIFSSNLCYSVPKVKSVAITDFTANGFSEAQSWIGESCASVIINRISSDRSIRIIERAQLNRIIEELKLQMGGLVNEKTVVETGNLIGVTYFITGSIALFEDQIILSNRAYSVETGEILSSNIVRGLLKNLFDLQEQLALKISDDLLIKARIEGNIDKPLASFEFYQKIEYLKKMAATVPKFNLDPRRKIRTNEYLNSIQQCDELIQLNPNYYLIHYYKGLFAMHLEEFDIAKKEIKLAVQMAPDSFDPLLLDALIFSNSGDQTEAKQILNLLTTKFPEQPEGWLVLSKVQTSENQTASATESLIRSLLGKNIIPQAIANLRSSLSVSIPKPEDFSDKAFYEIARLYSAFWKIGTDKKDIVITARSINQQFPDFYLPYYFIGRSDFEIKQFANAIISYQDCLSNYPNFPEAHRETALACFNLNQCSKAEKHVALYLQFADAVTDFTVIENARKKCK